MERARSEEGNLDKRQGAFVVCGVTPFFDIAWEDGTVERLVPNTGDITLFTNPDDLPPFSVPEFRADDFVISRDSDGSQRGEVGIVKSIDSINCTLCVGWLENLEHPIKFTKEEIVSIYDLVPHPDFYFSYGDIVFYPEPRSTNDSLSGSWIGRITGLKNGIEVNWADGTTSVVGPQAIQHALLYDPYSEVHERSDHESNDVVAGDTTSSSLGTCAGDVESSLEAGKIEEHGEPGDRVGEFDFLEDASKHHFVTAKIVVFRKEWFNNFNKELKILKENPNAFTCVQGYHTRMDLFTAVVVGSPGTPYHDGLFFFDLHLSAQYPDVPPAERTESWNPAQSNILQLLLSLQALVLCSRPYFNEYAHSKRIRESDVEKDSLNYNEAVFLKNCSIMLRVIEGPPKGFEEIVVNHFKKHGPFILSACRAYLKGSRVGSLGEDASCTIDSVVDSNSAGFKQSLQPIVLKLQTAFEKL